MSDIKEVADLIVKQGTAWEEYKKTNDKMLEAKADGKSVAEFKESLVKIEADMTEVRKSMAEIEKKAGRPGMGADGQDTEEKQAHRKAFDRYLRKGVDGNLNELQQKAMNTGSDPDGGYLVLPEMDATIDRIAPTVSAMFRLANVVTIGTAKYEKLVKTSCISNDSRPISNATREVYYLASFFDHVCRKIISRYMIPSYPV